MAMHVHTLRRMVPDYETRLRDSRRSQNRAPRRRFIDPYEVRVSLDCAGKRSSTPGVIFQRPRTAPYASDDVHQLLFSCTYRPQIRVTISKTPSLAIPPHGEEPRVRGRSGSARASVSNLSIKGLVPRESLSKNKHASYGLKQKSTLATNRETFHHRHLKEHPVISSRMRQGCKMFEILAHQ